MNIKPYLSIVFCCLISQLNAQIDYDIVESTSKKLFLQNIFIVHNESTEAKLGSILIEDGRIAQLGNITAPYDATVIPLDSMYAYPGFIAAISHTGIVKPEEKKEQPKPKFRGLPPNDLAGITPEKMAEDLFDPNESSIDKYRKAGFALVNAAPYGKMLPGKTSVFSLASKDKAEALVHSTTGLYATLENARRIYPETIIALMSKWRELFYNAGYASKYTKQYKDNPAIGSRPKYDKATEAMIPVADKNLPVFFKAENAKDIYRVLDLQNELGFKLVLSEVKQGWDISSKINSQSTGLLLSMDMPEEKDKQKEKEDSTKKEEKKISEEEMAFAERRKESYNNYINQAMRFSEAGIAFGFSFTEVKPEDIQSNLQKMHKGGLSESAIMKAMTSYPAQVLNMQEIAGSMDRGKMANLFVTDKPYLEEGAKIQFNIVEGTKFEYKKETDKESDTSELAYIVGKWKFSVEIEGVKHYGKLIVEGEDEFEIEIHRDDDGQVSNASNIIADGKELQFDFQTRDEGQLLDLEMKINFDGDSFEGKIISPFGPMPVEGSKIGPSK